MAFCFRLLTRFTTFTTVLCFWLSSFSFTSTDAYDPLNPTGNIRIKWDVMNWTPDGYVAVVTIYNFQQHRRVHSPGWQMGWTWAKKEVIWSMMGGRATKQGDCSKFKGEIPYFCMKSPTITDLLPGTPDRANSISSFQISVGAAGNTKKTVKLPKKYKLRTPGPGYTCGPAALVTPTKFITSDKRRVTQALMTWNITCTYSQFPLGKNPGKCNP